MTDRQAARMFVAMMERLRKAGCDDMEIFSWWCCSLSTHLDTAENFPPEILEFREYLRGMSEMTEELH